MELLFQGRTAHIYAWEEGQVLKLYQPGMPRQAVEGERRAAQWARQQGLAVPAVHDLVEVEDRCGFALEYIAGPTMMDELEAGRAVEETARTLALLHADLTSRPGGPHLPRQRQILQARISACHILSSGERQALLQALAALPDADALCHGDFHPRNLIHCGEDYFTIDWIDATVGNPAADLARTSILFTGHRATSAAGEEARRAMQRFHDVYLDTFCAQASVERGEYARWLPIVAAARLSEGIQEQEEWLLQQVRESPESDPC